MKGAESVVKCESSRECCYKQLKQIIHSLLLEEGGADIGYVCLTFVCIIN